MFKKLIKKFLDYFLSPCKFFDPMCRAYEGGGFLKCTCGKSGSPPPPPAAPSPGKVTKQSIQAQIDALPKILKAQQELGPQFSQTELDQLTEFGPQFAQQGIDLAREFGPQLAEQTRLEQGILAPERVAGSEAIADFISQGPDQLTPEEEDKFRQDVRAAQQTRGLAESGFGAQDEFARLTGLRQQLKNRFLDVSLSASGRLPAAGGSTVQNAPGASPSQLVQNVTPSEFFSGQASNNAFNSSIFQTQSQNARSSSSPFGSILGSVAGGFGGSFGEGLGGRFFN